MLLNDRLNMETLACTKCVGEIQGRSVIKFAIIDACSEEAGVWGCGGGEGGEEDSRS